MEEEVNFVCIQIRELLNKNIDTLVSIGGFAVSATGSVVPLNSQIPNANFTAF